ncbi:MAG: VOC family protein [Pyrinomonadaceae bacterium]|nr:VOC family protein [Pyrinomonadaceae bacterium]
MKIVLDHIVLNVRNVADSVTFYRDVLELEIERFDEFEKGRVLFPSARINEVTVIDLFPPKLWQIRGENVNEKAPNLNHFCLTYTESDWNKLTERLRFHGVKINRYADNNWGAQGIGISIYFNDVDGNEIEARYYQ